MRLPCNNVGPMRIVSLLPSVTEILFAVGAGDRVVGVTHECDFPLAARSLPVLTASLLPPALHEPAAGDAANGRAAQIDRHVRASVHSGSSLYALDAPLLAQLAPDLIITQELCKVCAVSYDSVARAVKQMRVAAGSPAVLSLEPSSLEDVYATILSVGTYSDAEAGAQALVTELRRREDRLRRRPVSERCRVLVLEWTDPPMSGGHWTPELVELGGGRPVLANPLKNSVRIEWTAIVAADPDVVIVAPCGYDLAAARQAVRELDVNPIWRTLRAVRTNRAFAMDGNAYVNRPGPRLLDTAEIFAAAIGGTPLPAGAIEALSLRSIPH